MFKQKRAAGRSGPKKNIFGMILQRASQAGGKRTAVLAGLLALLAGALIYWQYLMPLDTVKEGIQKENATQTKQISINEIVQQTRPSLIAEYRQAKLLYEKGRDLLPNNTELSRVMATIQEIARRNNVRVTLFDASTPNVKSPLGMTPTPAAPAETQPAGGTTGATNDPPLQPAPRPVLNERMIPAQLVGTHAGVMNFLRDLASYELIIHARDISIASFNKEESVNLRLVAFDAPPSSALPPDPPDLNEASQGKETADLNTIK